MLIGYFSHIISWFQRAPAKEMQRLLYGAIGIVSLIVGGMIFFVYHKSHELVDQLRNVEKTAQSSERLIDEYERLEQDENRIEEMLKQSKDEDIRSFFEKFCKEQTMTPEEGWDPVPRAINDKFEEIMVQATFKNQTTQKLVMFLDAIEKEATEKKKILYTKKVRIKRDQGGKTINFDLTIATIRMKREG